MTHRKFHCPRIRASCCFSLPLSSPFWLYHVFPLFNFFATLLLILSTTLHFSNFHNVSVYSFLVFLFSKFIPLSTFPLFLFLCFSVTISFSYSLSLPLFYLSTNFSILPSYVSLAFILSHFPNFIPCSFLPVSTE